MNTQFLYKNMQKDIRFEAIFENHPNGILLIELYSLNISVCNSTFAKSLGYSKEEVVGQSLNLFLTENSKKAIDNLKLDPILSTFQKDVENKLVIQQKHKNGNLIDKELIFQPYIYEENIIICYDREISSQLKFENELIQSNFEMREMQFAINKHAIIATTDTNGIITYVNNRFCEISGYSKEELLGKTHQIVNSGYHPKEFFAEMYTTLKKGETWHGEIRNKTKDGRYYWVSASISPLKNSTGEIDQYIAIRTDITVRKKIEDELRLSENKMGAILDNSFESIVFVDLDKKIQFFNQIASTRNKAFFGKELIVGNSIYDMVLPDDREYFDKNFNSALLGKRIILDRPNRINNMEYWFEFQFIPLRNEFKNIIGILYTARDINEKKYAEEILLQSEHRFHAIFDQAPLGIALVESKTGKFVQVNPKFCEILGYKESEILLKQFIDITHPDDIELSLYHWKTLLRGETKLASYEKRYIKKDGSIVWTNLTRVPLFEKEAKTTNHLLIVMDITNSKLSIETLNKYMKELENVNQTKNKFFSIIAHDLRNPFYGILGITEILNAKLKQETLNETLRFYQRYILMIHNSAKSAFDLLDNLMQWARSQTGEITIKPKNHSLNHLLSHTISIVAVNAFKKNIGIEKDLADNDTVYADELLSSTILRNLLTNAIKFSHPNGKVILSTKSANEFLEISIIDNGVGIDPANLEKIFKIDSKFSKIGTDNEKGTGLGLILCKEFAEKQGGTIWVDSQLGKGSTFTFTLPLGK